MNGDGGNNMAKAMYRKENRELHEIIERYSKELPFVGAVIEAIKILIAAKIPKKCGKGNPYANRFNCHISVIDAMLTEARKYFQRGVGVGNIRCGKFLEDGFYKS